MKSIKVCEYSRSRSFHDDLILQDQASGERSQDQWSSGICIYSFGFSKLFRTTVMPITPLIGTAVMRMSSVISTTVMRIASVTETARMQL